MKDLLVRRPFFCVEVRRDGSIVRPVLRHDGPEDAAAWVIEEGTMSRALFDGAWRHRDDAIMSVLRQLG